VAVNTIGLIAGAASKNANAAAGVTPWRTNAPATGTDAHSQPGSTAPATPATGTARSGRAGNAQAKNDGGMNATMSADSSTPRTRNGRAWSITATNTVIQVCIAGADNARRIGACNATSGSSNNTRTSSESICCPLGSSGSSAAR
jgi:hypothetical protein